MLKSKKEKIEKETLKEELKNVNIPVDEADVKNTGEVPDEKSESSESAELVNQVEYYKDQFLRKAAEFENYKRRTEAEISSLFRYAGEGLITGLLPVLDDFNRIKKSWDENHDDESFKKGIDLVCDKFANILSKQGLKVMEAEGKQFDVNLHDALLQQPTGDVEQNTVIGVIENGYYLKDKVIRHAKVIVSAKPEKEE